jgi:dephospho-CoA kinase
MSKVIGITGCVASGKTSVLKYLNSKGYPCFSADDVVKQLYSEESIQNSVLNIFPELENRIDKQKIALIIYTNEDKRGELEALLHPIIINKLRKFIDETRGSKMVFAEIPLLFEKSMESMFECIITVFCASRIRLERAVESKKMSQEIFGLINNIQMNEHEKIRRSNFTIDTTSGEGRWKLDVDKVTDYILAGKMSRD